MTLTCKLPSLTCKLRKILLASCLAAVTFGSPATAQDHRTALEIEDPLVMMVLQEANRQPFNGMVAVAAVALDRVNDPRWPNNLTDVLYQRKQFSGLAPHVKRGDYPPKDIETAYRAITMAILGQRPCGHEVFWYHADYIELPYWARDQLQMTPACHIGSHIFYRNVRSD